MMTFALEHGVDPDNVLAGIHEEIDDDDISSCFRSQRFHDFLASAYVGEPRMRALRAAKDAERLSRQAVRAREGAAEAARQADNAEQ